MPFVSLSEQGHLRIYATRKFVTIIQLCHWTLTGSEPAEAGSVRRSSVLFM